jgi:hypothetical protein
MLLSTPLTLIGASELKNYFNVDLNEQYYLPLSGQTIRKRIYKYHSGQIAKIEYLKFDSEDWIGHADSFYRDSVWTYFNRFGDTTKVEYYKRNKLVKTVNK